MASNYKSHLGMANVPKNARQNMGTLAMRTCPTIVYCKSEWYLRQKNPFPAHRTGRSNIVINIIIASTTATATTIIAANSLSTSLMSRTGNSYDRMRGSGIIANCQRFLWAERWQENGCKLQHSTANESKEMISRR